jgi:glyoxylase-like metal-dependent hydrolase (beta-lactamase superfamily II)
MRALSTLLLALLPALLGAQEPVRTADITLRGLKPTEFPRIQKLAENVYSYEQIDPSKRVVTVNNLIVVTTDGVLIAESQGTAENVNRLVADVATLTTQPIKYVVIGSEHGDHVGGIEAFPNTVTFIAHPSSAPKLKRPAETISEPKKVLMMGGTEIDILFLGRAHTGGDLEVYLPRERILWMSEVFVNRVFPSMANGYPTEWIATLSKAEAINAVARGIGAARSGGDLGNELFLANAGHITPKRNSVLRRSKGETVIVAGQIAARIGGEKKDVFAFRTEGKIAGSPGGRVEVVLVE